MLCFALLFYQEIAGDGRALQGDGLALLSWENCILLHFFINKLQVMDVLFEETHWLCFAFFIWKLQVMDMLFEETDRLCSPGTYFAPLGESHERGQTTHKHTPTWTDFATTRKNRPMGEFFENTSHYQKKFKQSTAVVFHTMLFITACLHCF